MSRYRPPQAREASNRPGFDDHRPSNRDAFGPPRPRETVPPQRAPAPPVFISPASPAPSPQEMSQLQNYFKSFGAPLDPHLEQRQHRSGGGGASQIFVASLDVPNNFGSPLTMTAEGTSKKTAKFALMQTVVHDLKTRGWLQEARPPQRSSDRGTRGGSAQSAAAQRAREAHRSDQWDQSGVKPTARSALPSGPGPAASEAHVPSAWDDEPVQTSRPRGGHSSRRVVEEWERVKPIPRPGQSLTERVISAWDDDVPDEPSTYKQGSYDSRSDRPSRPSQSPVRGPTPTARYSDGPVPPNNPHADPQQHGRAGGSWFSEADRQHGYGNDMSMPLGHSGPGLGNQSYAPDQRAQGPMIPPPNAVLPGGFDGVEQKFVEFYCKTNNLPMPKPVQQQAAAVKAFHAPRGKMGRFGRNAPRGKGGLSKESTWEVELRLPAHRFEGQQINEIVIVGSDKAKKMSGIKAWAYLAGHLLAIVNQSYVDIFKMNLIPIKQRIKEMLDFPVSINMTEAAVVRLDNMLGQLRSAEAFDFIELDGGKATVGDTLGLSSRLGAPPPNSHIGHAVLPSDIVIPRELENNQLPIFSQYREIISAIDNNPVTILSAETGAGKTTQLPQFLLAHYRQQRSRKSFDGRPANIVITQPRRIAAISVAQRVASERNETIGKDSAIGYQVRFDDKRPMSNPDDGHAVFCTSGILLKRLQEDPQLQRVTHIILDEVHERDLNTDLLLIIVRQLVQARPDLRVILMSATAETELFQDYFQGFGIEGARRLPPIIKVAGRMFPVQQYFLEDLSRLLNEPRALPGRFQPTKETMHWVHNETGPMIPPRGEDPVPYDYLEALIAHISTTRDEGAILVFLPGWQEIDTLLNRLKDEDHFRVGFRDENRFRVYPLHSSIPTGAQQLVFDTPPNGIRKIILSTNIAETSVTINDVVYVIDAGKTRMNSYDADRRISSLSSVWASLSNLRQRSGRAGRCRPGMYFSLLSHRRKESVPYSMPPELLRVDLQSTVLKIKSLRLARHVGDVFAAAPQPPSPGNVKNAINELRALGALDDQENLTTLGHVLSTMPVDPWIGKMVLEAATLGCLDPILTIAGGMEIGRGIFAIHPDEKEQGRAHILAAFAAGTDSDHLTLLNAFRGWKKMYDQSGGRGGHAPAARDYARANYLHHNSLANVERSRQQLLRILEDCGLVAKSRFTGASIRNFSSSATELMGGSELNAFANSNAMIRAVLCGALYPNIAEIGAKDEYASRTDYKLRLTSSSVNSWRGVVASATASVNAVSGVSNGRRTPGSAAASDVGDYDYIPDDNSLPDGDIPLLAATVPPLPPRLLSFQEKQRVDGGLYLRNTTRTDAAALFLFASNAANVQSAWRDERPELVVDGWIHIAVPSAQHVRVLLEMRAWLEAYIKWAVWSRQQRQLRNAPKDTINEKSEANAEKWDLLGKMLIREVAAIVEDGEQDRMLV
ncbi:hypothetical protein HKX48_004931 [Thoreauomyces humboldtii]|nr:hypothetical protein HKX48_004931 [Thoreauomyces humboldtii]